MEKNKLECITGEYLMNTPIEKTDFIVSSLIPQGLHVLGGAPKIGKLWLVLFMCLKIANGENIWDFKTNKGTVLYLALEDSYSRLQDRLFDITDDATENICFSIMVNSLADGLGNQIEAFIEEHKNTKFIVIDTLQKVRSSSSDKNSYANDYKDIEMLKTIADKHKIVILLVYNLRKLIDDDPINMILGSTGLTGAVDTIYVLKKTKRNSTKAKLYVTGRDIEDKELTLEFDKLTHIWNLLPETVHMQQMDNNEKLCECLKLYLKEKKIFTGTATELSEILKQYYNFDIMPNILSKIILQNEMKLIKNGVTCKFKRTAQKRQITLLYTYNIDDNKNY